MARSLRRSDRWFLRAMLITLPFAYVPLEVTHRFISLPPFILALSLVLAVRLGVKARADAVEKAAGLYLGYIAVRVFVMAPINGDGIDAGLFLDELSRLGSAVVLYRVFRRRDLVAVALPALLASLCLVVGIEALQKLEGVGRLQSLGYITPKFRYYTSGGDFRPFGGLFSPTVFGAYLSVLGVFLCCAYMTSRRRVFVFGLTGVGLLVTQTRAAWIAFAVGLFVAMLASRRVRSSLTRSAIPLTVLVCTALTLLPGFTAGVVARAETVTDNQFSSNVGRSSVWSGTLDAIADEPTVGYGSADFALVLNRYVPPSVAALGHPHNSYLYVAFKFGVVALGFMVLTYVALWRRLRRAIRVAQTHRLVVVGALAATASVVVNSLFEQLWASFNVVALLYVLAGIAVGCGPARHVGKCRPTPEPMLFTSRVA